MKPHLDVVVVNHRTPEFLASCLASIRQYPPRGRDGYDVPYTVTVVHTMPEPDDLQVADHFVHQRSELGLWHELVWEENVGYNVACNHAGAWGRAEFIAFLNADTQTSNDAFGALCAELEDRPDMGIVGPRQVNSRHQLTAAGIFGTNTAPTMRSWHHEDRGQCSEDRDDAAHVAGSFVVMRRTVFDQLTECPTYRKIVEEPGPWGDFLHYFGDQWLGYHARAHGYLCGYRGSVQCVHEWHKASAVGGYGETNWAKDHDRFAELCDAHGLDHN